METIYEPVEILLIEDSPGDARLIEEMLYEVDGTLFNVENACRLSDGLTRIAKRRDRCGSARSRTSGQCRA